MKLKKVIIVDDEGNEKELDIVDGTMVLLCQDEKILSQFSTNAAINLEIIKRILK